MADTWTLNGGGNPDLASYAKLLTAADAVITTYDAAGLSRTEIGLSNTSYVDGVLDCDDINCGYALTGSCKKIEIYDNNHVRIGYFTLETAVDLTNTFGYVFLWPTAGLTLDGSPPSYTPWGSENWEDAFAMASRANVAYSAVRTQLRNVFGVDFFDGFEGNKIKLVIAPCSADYEVTHCTIGNIVTGSTFVTSPIPVTFNTGSASVSVTSAGGDIESDPINFLFDPSNIIGIHLDLDKDYIVRSNEANTSLYGKITTDESSVLAISEYAPGAGSNYVLNVAGVKVLTSYYDTVTEEPEQVIYNGVTLTKDVTHGAVLPFNTWSYDTGTLYINVGGIAYEELLSIQYPAPAFSFSPVWTQLFDMAFNEQYVVGGTAAERLKITAATYSKTGYLVRATLAAHGTSETVVTGLSIGPGVSEDFTSAPTRLTFSSNNGVTIAAGQTAVSDAVLFDFDNTSAATLVHIQYSTCNVKQLSLSNWAIYYKQPNASDDTMVQDITGYTRVDNYTSTLKKIEVASCHSSTLADEPSYLTYNQTLLTRDTGAGADVDPDKWDWAAGVLYLSIGGIPDPDLIYLGETAAPTVITSPPATAISYTTATVAGNVTSDGGSAITERGVCYGTTVDPTTAGDKEVVSGTTGAISADLTGLSADTGYYARAYATNAEGTSYGENVQFSTLAYTAPTVTTGTATATGLTTGTVIGNVSADGGQTITERGVCYSSTSTEPTISDDTVTVAGTTGAFDADLTGLTSFTAYYARAYATNSVGTAYGTMVSFVPGVYEDQTLPVVVFSLGDSTYALTLNEDTLPVEITTIPTVVFKVGSISYTKPLSYSVTLTTIPTVQFTGPTFLIVGGYHDLNLDLEIKI